MDYCIEHPPRSLIKASLCCACVCECPEPLYMTMNDHKRRTRSGLSAQPPVPDELEVSPKLINASPRWKFLLLEIENKCAQHSQA